MKRLLCIVGNMNAGGAETFLMKVYRQLDKSEYQMDFAVASADRGFYEDEIERLGGKVHRIVPKSQGVIKNFSSILKLVKDNHYRHVLRTSQHSLSALELLAAKMGGAKVRVFRSSNSNTTTGSGKDLLLHRLCRFMPMMFANVRIAPSTEAAEFMFGKGCVEKGKAKLVHNGLDLIVFRFDAAARASLRRELKLENSFVVGHVGRFNQQKNHSFLLDVFCEIKKIVPSAKLVLVGKGELESKIHSKASQLGIAEDILFTGVRDDVPKLLSAFDVFVFPSLYEGMPNTVIEAQATGLPCVVSDTITREAAITDRITYLSLSDTAMTWAKCSADRATDISDEDRKRCFLPKEYDIKEAVNQFESIIFGDR